MVGLMATWSTTRGSAAFVAAVGLVVLALVIATSAPTWAPGNVQRSAATDVVVPGAEVSAMSTMPQPPVRNPEHLPRLWPARHRALPAPERPVPSWPEAGSAAIRGPQQPGHRAAGSRSPPSA